jgi:choline dehydrogenase-like flavoprotein
VTKLHEDADGRIAGVEMQSSDQSETLSAPIIVVAAGAVQTAALLLASANENSPHGIANRSDQVGRNFMNHNCSAVLVVRFRHLAPIAACPRPNVGIARTTRNDKFRVAFLNLTFVRQDCGIGDTNVKFTPRALYPLRRNTSVYQKTLMMNDFYLGHRGEPPLGNVQILGKITGPILAANSNLPMWIANAVAVRSFDFYAMSEDLPNPESRVTLQDGQIKRDWQRSNWGTHLRLVAKLKSVLRKVGFPLVMSRAFDRRTPSHQCGTARMGADPQGSVVNTFCRSHDHKNMSIVDASVLPTSAAVNPALTIAALALRTGRHIMQTEFAA